MFKKNLFIFCIVLVFQTQPFQIQLGLAETLNGAIRISPPEKSLTLSQAYDIALKQNLDIQAAKAQMGEAQADILIAKIRQNPMLMSDLGLRAEKTYRIAGLSFTLEAPGKRHRRILVAEAQAHQKALDIAQSIAKTLGQVHQAYAEWVADVAQLHCEEDNAEILQNIAAVAQQRYSGKEVEELDVNQSQMLLVNAQKNVLAAKQDLQTAQITLQTLLNTEQIIPPTLEAFYQITPHPVEPLPQLVQKALTHRKDLLSNQTAMEVEAKKINYYKRSRIPNLNITSGFDLVQPMPRQYVAGMFQMAQLELPIFNRQQGNIAKSSAVKKRLQAEGLALRLQIKQDIEINLLKSESLQAQWNLCQQKLLPLAAKVDQQALASYQHGKTAINDALGQHQNAYNMRQDAVKTYLDYQMAMAHLQMALNRSLSDNDADDSVDFDFDD